MSLRMKLLRKTMRAARKTDSGAVKRKNTMSLKEAIVPNDYFRSINKYLERFVVKNVYHTITKIAGIKCHKLGINPNRKYFARTKLSEEKLLFYIHGGGFCRGFPLHGVFYMKAMMKRLGCRAIAVDYSLSPENIYPTALNEIVSVYKVLLKSYAPENIIVTGDSAGGNLGLALLMYLRDNEVPLPSCGVFLSGYFNLNNDSPSYEINKDSDVSLSKEVLDLMAQTYVKGDYCKIPNALCNKGYTSPIRCSFEGLPPLMFTVCSDELLYDDSAKAYAEAKKKNEKTILYVDKECFHAYPIIGDITQESKKACNEIEKFIKNFY